MTTVVPLNPGLWDLSPKARCLVIAPRPPSVPPRSRCSSTRSTREAQAAGESKHFPIRTDRDALSATKVLPAPEEKQLLDQLETMLREKLASCLLNVQVALSCLDPEGKGSVSTKDLIRVLETFCFPLSQSQLNTLLTKVSTKRGDAVDYMQFLKRYCPPPTARKPSHNTTRSLPAQDTCMSLTEMKTRLRSKISSNLKTLIRVFRLMDYNRDGRVQQHEFRRILNNYCFPLSEKEFLRLWKHYSPNNMATMAYNVFLEKLGFTHGKNRQLKSNNCLQERATEKKRPHSTPHNATGDIASIQNLTEEQLQALFLEKLRQNCAPVWQTLQAFDAAYPGLVSTEDIRAILSKFQFPMSLHTFHMLTSCFGLKNASTAKWKEFLGQFMNPTNQEGRANQEGRSTPKTDKAPELSGAKSRLNLQVIYPMLKRVFLLLDKEGSGCINRADLCKVLGSIQCYSPEPGTTSSKPCTPRTKLSQEQIRELAILLDPEHTGVISLASLEKLDPVQSSTLPPHSPIGGSMEVTEEEKASDKNTQWTKPDSMTPALRTQVEADLLDKLCNQISAVLGSVMLCDPKRTGFVKKEELRKVILRYDPTLTEAHYSKLCKPCLEPASSCEPGTRVHQRKVNYFKFLKNLGMPLSVRSQSTSNGDDTPRGQQLQSPGASTLEGPDTGPEAPPGNTGVRSVEDIVFRRLRKDLDKLHITVQDRLQATSRSKDGTISTRDLKRLLDGSYIILEEKQFLKLTALLGFKEGKISRSEFLAKYEKNRSRDLGFSQGNHGNTAVDKSQYLTADDCLSLMKERIQSIHGDTQAAFHLMDKDSDGKVNAHDFRDLFDSLGLVATEKELQRLMVLIGLEPECKLNYSEFERIVQSNGQFCRPQNHLISLLDQLHGQLVIDAKRIWPEMLKVLSRIGDDGVSQVFKKGLRDFLYTYDLPLRAEEFEELWSRYDPEHRGYVACTEFLERLGVDPDMEQRKDDRPPTRKGSAKDPVLTSADAMREIWRVVRNNCTALSSSLRQLDHRNSGLVELDDMLALLQTYDCYLRGDQLRHILNTLKVPVDREGRKLAYLNFLKMFERDKDKGSKPQSPIGEDLGWVWDIVLARLPTISKELEDLDKGLCNTITKEDFRNLCQRHIPRLSAGQFDSVWSKVPVNSRGELIYREFLRPFYAAKQDTTSTPEEGAPANVSSPPSRGPVETTPPSVAQRPKTTGSIFQRPESGVALARARRPSTSRMGLGHTDTPPLDSEGLQRKLPVAVRHCWREIQRGCMEHDPTREGEISAHCFQGILQDLGIIMSQDEFERLAMPFDSRSNGCVSYIDFLRHFLLNFKPPKKQPFERSKLPLPRIPMSEGVLSGQCVEAMLKIYYRIQLSWRRIRHSFLVYDHKHCGQISMRTFRQVLRLYNVNLTEEDFFHICSYYDKDTSGNISYNEFLQAFVH